MTSDLSSRLAEYVAEVEPVILSEVTEEPYVQQTWRHGRPGLIVAGIAAAVVLIGAVGLVSLRGETGEPGAVGVSPVAPTVALDVTTCAVQPDSQGCEATPEEAERVLGIDLPTPAGIPAGWVLRSQHIRFWPKGHSGASEAAVTYDQIWAPPGEDFSEGSSPTYIHLTRRRADVGGLDGDGSNAGPGAVFHAGLYIRLFAPYVDQSIVDRIFGELTAAGEGVATSAN
jgi:hypothetical protein